MWTTLIGSNKNKGFLVTEVVVVVAIITIIMGSLIIAAFLSLKASSSVEQISVANNLAQESLEALRNFRDGTDWSTAGLGILPTGNSNPFQIRKSSSAWSVSPGEETIGNFTRKIIIESVSRDAGTGMIESVYDSARDDPETKKVIVTVYWGAKQVQLTAYFTNWRI